MKNYQKTQFINLIKNEVDMIFGGNNPFESIGSEARNAFEGAREEVKQYNKGWKQAGEQAERDDQATPTPIPSMTPTPTSSPLATATVEVLLKKDL
jgi:hypothetical protein